MVIIILAAIGFVISLYGIMVERALAKNASYKPACDISDSIACTRPMLSSYGTLLGISNSLAAALYYLTIATLTLLQQKQLVLLIVFAGLIVTILFAYILYVKLRSLCLICTALYCIKITLALVCCIELSS